MAAIIVITTVIIIFLYVFNWSPQSNVTPPNRQRLTTDYENSIKKLKEEAKEIKVPTVSSLVKSVKTKEDIEVLEKEADRWIDKFQETDFEISKYEKLYTNYEDALRIIYYTPIYYQYFPEIELTSPQKVMDNAYKVVSADDFKRENKEIEGVLEDWIEILGMELMEEPLENLIEQKPKYWDSLISFQQIVNSKISYLEKVKIINELSISDKSFTDEFFFFLEEDELAGESWIKDLIRSYGVPLVDQLYDMGYNTPDKYIDLNLELIEKTKGFGPKRIEKLKAAIKKIKKEHS